MHLYPDHPDLVSNWQIFGSCLVSRVAKNIYQGEPRVRWEPETVVGADFSRWNPENLWTPGRHGNWSPLGYVVWLGGFGWPGTMSTNPEPVCWVQMNWFPLICLYMPLLKHCLWEAGCVPLPLLLQRCLLLETTLGALINLRVALSPEVIIALLCWHPGNERPNPWSRHLSRWLTG